jgi:hypothetical protein
MKDKEKPKPKPKPVSKKEEEKKSDAAWRDFMKRAANPNPPKES